MRFFLSPRGRMSRRQWWTLAVPVMASAFVLAGLIDVFFNKAFFLLGPARLWIGAVLLWPSFALLSRRLHDLDRSAATLFPLAALIVAALLIGFVGVGLTGETITIFSAITVVMLWFVGCALAALVIVLSTAPGQRGTNRHGPDPLTA